ncbi:MAG: hypothetical protein HYX84_04095 [Chloroflexi bacterium]|nr:hypothetical protein [Chloroflexota bacterium]
MHIIQTPLFDFDTFIAKRGNDRMTEVLRLLERDKDIRVVCGFSKDHIPRHDAMCRFLRKLVGHADLVKESRQLLPGFGDKLAVDSTDIKAYSSR